MKEKLKGKFKYVIMAVVLLIPFMYSFFYLKSYWNPYGNLQDLGVAIVNNDETNSDSLSDDFIKSLKDSDSCKFVEVASDKAYDGLINGKYYAIITLPKNFTDNINNSGEKNRQVTTITYTPNQKSNYLASQIISRIVLESEKGLEGKISSSIVGSLVDNLQNVPDSLQKVIDGTDELKSGSNSLSSGLSEINNGTSTLANKYQELDNGIDNAKNGADQLQGGLSALQNGVSSLQSGANSLNSGLTTLGEGILNYTGNTQRLTQLLTACTNNGQVNLTQGQCAYIPALIQGLSDQTTIAKLTTGSSALVKGSSDLQNGLNTLQSGSNTLQNGVSLLQSGLITLSDGSKTVKNSLDTLSNGTKTAYDGSINLNNGIDTFKNEIVKSKNETEGKVNKLDGLSEYINDSVEINEKDKGEVSAYGVSFTPLFLSIGLWVGALMCYVVLYYDQEHRFNIFDKEKRGIKQNFAYIGLSILFGLVTAFLIKSLLGFNVTSVSTYYLSSVLISITFMSIIQLLIRVFSDIGKFIALVILVLQLAASGGTFPVETIDRCFQWLNNLLPMTYSIRLIKEAVISTDSGFAFNNSIVLILFAGISIILTCTYDIIKSKKAK